MSQVPAEKEKGVSPDWFVQGVLTRLGDVIDRFLGRGWKPSSSLATSELAERLKRLLDSQVVESPSKARYVPNNIQLRTQWDKFAEDSDGLRSLENELLTAAIDHINDKRYLTYAPMNVQVKPDYFTSGVKLSASFDREEGVEANEAEVSVDVPKNEIASGDEKPQTAAYTVTLRLSFDLEGQETTKTVVLTSTGRYSIGRTRENDLAIDHPSVSKTHAVIALNAGGTPVVADVGSTNGTFIDGRRIAYGKAVEFVSAGSITFGSVEVTVRELETTVPDTASVDADDSSYRVGEFAFESRTKDPGQDAAGSSEDATHASPEIPVDARGE